jgi:hypothetical protein
MGGRNGSWERREGRRVKKETGSRGEDERRRKQGREDKRKEFIFAEKKNKDTGQRREKG